MRVQVTNDAHLDRLIDSLRADPDAIVARLTDNELEVSLLGSYAADAMRMELYLRLRAWETAPPAAGAQAEIVG
jgi:hypothetical protein